MQRWVIALLLACATACAPTSRYGGNVAYRYSSGGAYGRVGVGSGGTGSIYYSDRGGPLMRALLVALALAGAASAVHVETKTFVDDQGDEIVIHEESTVTVDAEALAAAQKLEALALDPNTNFAEKHAQGYSGMTGSIEIASRNLGGDTSGWMVGLGYERKTASRFGYEFVAKLGVGKFTLHDRSLTGYDDVMGRAVMMTGDSTYPFLGLNVRFGLVFNPSAHATFGTSLEAFVAPDLNFFALEIDDKNPTDNTPASVWHAGLRLTTLAYTYIEGSFSFSSLLDDHKNLGMEVGFAF